MSNQTSSYHHLGVTARHTAAARAQESQSPDCLFNDPWAERLAGREGKEWIEHQSLDSGISIIVRARFFDDFFKRVMEVSPIRQVVLLAAGLDTRAYRLPWPDHTRLFELDQPHVLEYKEQVLTEAGAQPLCERKALPVDLTSTFWSETLLQAGFQPESPSVWLLEGLLLYLPQATITRLLNEITSLATSDSWLGFDIVNHAMLTSPWTRQWVESLAKAGTPWMSAMDDPEADLSALGWQAQLSQPGEADAHYGRWPYPAIPRTMPSMPRHWLVTAHKN
jgi:methyltransferase (TIGR00027 family)